MFGRNERDPDRRKEQKNGHRDGPERGALARMHGVEIMPDGDAHQEDERGNDPVVRRGKGQRIVVGQHQEDDWQGEIIVVGRTDLGDLAIFGVWRPACLEILDHDALVGDDDEKDVGGHDGCGKGPQMEHHGPSGENLVIAPAHNDKEDEEQDHQQGWLFIQLRLAQKVIDQPTDGQGTSGYGNCLPGLQLQLGGINKEQVGPVPVGDHKHGRAGDPGHVAFPFEPYEMLGHVFRRDQEFADMVEAATMDLPFLAMGTNRQIRSLAQAQIQRDEVEA